MKNRDEANLNYIAGIIDGEGTAGVYIINRSPSKTHKNGYGTAMPVIAVKMCDSDPVQACHEAFPGFFKKLRSTPGRKDVYCWTVSHRRALDCAVTMLPFLRNKSKIEQIQSIVIHYEKFTNPRRGEHRYKRKTPTNQLRGCWEPLETTP
jgi:hypothetical protein